MKRNWRGSVRHEVGLFIFAVFCAWLFIVTIAPPWQVSGEKNINYIPFLVIRRSLNDWNYNGSVNYFTVNLLGNIMVFVPIGFFVFLLWKVSPLKCVLIGFALSMAIECVQYPIGRWTDIDDLWLNTLGTLLGLLLCTGFKTLAQKLTNGFRVK